MPRGRQVTLVAVLILLGLLAGCGSAPGATGSPVRTPTATPTAEQRVAALAQRAANDRALQSVSATFDAGSGPSGGQTDAGMAVTLTATLAGPVPATDAEVAAQERVKTLSFRMERALWTSGMRLREVKVLVNGPIYDDYADLTTGPYGAADLSAATATRLDWPTLTPDTAWSVYGAWLRPAYHSKVLGQ